MKRLEGKVAGMTGGKSGVSRAEVVRLGDEGARMAICGVARKRSIRRQ
jgi:NAD(P)-dependent dehydrogenase (short-subunit alcohol dehydrogenase family)